MRLEQLLYCIEVANSKTMSQAAKKLFMTQSSLSTAIQNLEEELGFQIFKRSNHGVLLTDKGSIFLEKAVAIASQVEEIKNLAVNEAAITRNITIAAVPIACNAIIVDLIQEIKKKKSNTNLNIIELRPDKIISSLAEGRADIAIGSYSESIKGSIFNEAAKYNINITPIFKDHMYAFLGRNHPKARQISVTMAELQGSPQAFFDNRVPMEANESNLHGGMMAGNFYSFSDRASIKKVVASRLAYAILPFSMAYDDIYIDSGRIKALPLSDADVTMTIYVAYKNNDTASKEPQSVISIIENIYQKVEEQMNHRAKHTPSSCINNNLLSY